VDRLFERGVGGDQVRSLVVELTDVAPVECEIVALEVRRALAFHTGVVVSVGIYQADVLEMQKSRLVPPTTNTVHVTEGAVQQFLLRNVDPFLARNRVGGFECADRSERPATTTGPLTLYGGDAALLPPIPLRLDLG